MPCVKYH